MTYEAVTSFLTEVRTAALQSSSKCRILQVAHAIIAVERKRGGWDYRINRVDYSLRQFEQALMMAVSLPDVEPEETTCINQFSGAFAVE